jgi:hypothetical protein
MTESSPLSVFALKRLGSTMSKSRLGLALGSIATVLLGWSSVAQGKDEFPSDVQSHLSHLGLQYEIPCSVCHIKGNTGSSTPITPFALALRARGLAGDKNSLATALDRLGADGVDSDGDGTTDIAELIAGTDPNSSANASIKNDQEPGYGCGGTAPTGRGGGGGGVGSVVAVGWFILRRRRARS